jgi:acyl-CoA thioesterase I
MTQMTLNAMSFVRRARCFAALLCIAWLSACGQKVPSLPSLPNDGVILAFGDSLTFGTGAKPEESYPAQLASRISRRVVAHGVPGELSVDGLARLPAVLDEVQPKLLLLCHGGNDFLRKQSESVAAANVRAMVKLAKDRGIAVVLLATPKPGLSVSAPDFYKEIANEFSLPIENDVLSDVLKDNAKKSDLVHPNAAGYREIAEAMAALLKKAGAV